MYCCRVLAGIDQAESEFIPREEGVVLPDCPDILANSDDDCMLKMCTYMGALSSCETSATSDSEARKDILVAAPGQTKATHAFAFLNGKEFCEDVVTSGTELYNIPEGRRNSVQALFLRGHYGDYSMAFGGSDGWMRFCGTKTVNGWNNCSVESGIWTGLNNKELTVADIRCPQTQRK